MQKKHSLIVFTLRPASFEERLIALLRVRGSFHSATFEPDTMPGLHEPTCVGFAATGEHSVDALIRISEEKFGVRFGQLIRSAIEEDRMRNVHVDEEEECVAAFLPDSTFVHRDMRIIPGWGDLRLIGRAALLHDYSGAPGILTDTRRVTVMPQYIHAIKAAFHVFEKYA